MERFRSAVAVHALLIKNRQVLFSKRANTGYEDGKWSLPAGHVDPGESAVKALLREVFEELGVHVHRRDIQFEHILHKCGPVDREERIDLFFTCSKWEGEIRNCEPDKCDALQWYDLDSPPVGTISYIAHTLEEIRAGRKFSEFGWSISS